MTKIVNTTPVPRTARVELQVGDRGARLVLSEIRGNTIRKVEVVHILRLGQGSNVPDIAEWLAKAVTKLVRFYVSDQPLTPIAKPDSAESEGWVE